MYLKVDPNGDIFQRKEIAGWHKAQTVHQAALVYIDAAMHYDGSILAISTAGQLHLLATPSGPRDHIQQAPANPHSVATLLDGSVLVLTTAGALWCGEFARGPWRQIALPGGLVPIDIAVTGTGFIVCLDAAGAIHQASVPGAPRPNQNVNWVPTAMPALANIVRIEYLRDGSRVGIDNAHQVHVLPLNAGAWQQVQGVGPLLAVTQLGGHTLLAVDQADNRLMTADALLENWVQVPGPAAVPGPGAVPVLAVAHLRTGHIAALGNNGQIYRAPFAVPPAGGAPVIGGFVPFSTPPVPPITMTVSPSGRFLVVGNNHRLYTFGTVGLGDNAPHWYVIDTGGTLFNSVVFLEDGYTMYGIDSTGVQRLICRPDQTSTADRTAPWVPLGNGVAASCVARAKDGAILEIIGNALHRKPSVQAANSLDCGWAGPCVQVIELSSDPQDTLARTRKWLLEFTSEDPVSELGGGRPWADGTAMAGRAAARRQPWDAGSRVTPLIGGFAALSAMRDAFEAAIIDASASANAVGQRGYVYIADWLLTPLRDLSEDNYWGGINWDLKHPATRDQTAIGLIARMMSAGIKVRVAVWTPTTLQAKKFGAHARQHWHLARMVQELNDRLKNQGGPWANVDLGVVALDLRTPRDVAVSIHQKMCVVRVGEVNVGFCGGVDLAFTRRDFKRPADGIVGMGDWQSGDLMPVISDGWPQQNPQPLCGYPTILRPDSNDVIADELGKPVYGTLRHWHDQHLKLEGPIVTSLEEQFDERWRLPGRPFLFSPDGNYGTDDQVQFTSASAFTNLTIHPLTTTACAPAGNAVVQLWRTIPVDNRRRDRAPFGRGEFTVMAGICKAMKQAQQLITIWDQYFWSEPLSRLLAAQLHEKPDLKVLIVLPPYGSSDPENELKYRKRALQRLWSLLTTPAERARVVVCDLWSSYLNIGVYVHAKVQTYDDCLLVCGSANMNRRSFTLDMELDCAVLHRPDVQYHLANLSLMLTGQPWQDFAHGWLQRLWTHLTTVPGGQTTIPDPFFCAPAQIGTATPNGVPISPTGKMPEAIYEPTSVDSDVETVDAGNFRQPDGTTGRLDLIVWLLEHYTEKGDFPYRYPKLIK